MCLGISILCLICHQKCYTNIYLFLNAYLQDYQLLKATNVALVKEAINMGANPTIGHPLEVIHLNSALDYAFWNFLEFSKCISFSSKEK